jgi:hypothetical protein
MVGERVMKEFYVEFPKSKSEVPAFIVLGIIVLVGFAFHYDFFGWIGGAIWLAVAGSILGVVLSRLRGEYFIRVNENGIEFRQHLFSKLLYIPWNYLQRIDYLEFEINFMIKETAQVVSFATSGMTDEEAEALKQYMSDMLAQREAQG